MLPTFSLTRATTGNDLAIRVGDSEAWAAIYVNPGTTAAIQVRGAMPRLELACFPSSRHPNNRGA